MAFTLHPRLASDTYPIGSIGLCALRLMCNAEWPWVILVPARDGMRELHQLAAADRLRLMEEIATVSTVMEGVFRPEKLNVAAIGNVVPQLHIHVVARRVGDAAWPDPVWGSGFARAYEAGAGEALAARLAAALGL